MTVNKTFLPELSCHYCEYIGDNYTLKESGPHTAAICPNCDKHIKYLSKEDKYGTKEQAAEIWDKTNGRCCYCGVVLNPFKRNGYTYEHVNPQSNGGGHETSNLLPCCKSCNSSKGKKSLAEYRAYMKKELNKIHHFFYFEVAQYGPALIGDILKKIL